MYFADARLSFCLPFHFPLSTKLFGPTYAGGYNLRTYVFFMSVVECGRIDILSLSPSPSLILEGSFNWVSKSSLQNSIKLSWAKENFCKQTL